MCRSLELACVLALTVAPPAQERDITGIGPILALDTMDQSLANFAVRLCGGDPTVLEPSPGQCYRVEVSIEGDVSIRLAQRAGSTLEFSLDPGQIYGLLDETVGAFRIVVRGILWGWLSGLGMEPRTISKVIRAARTFPDQIERIELKIDGSEDDDFRLDLTLRPKAGSWLLRVVSGLQPSERGAHLLRSPEAWFSLAVAVQGPGVLVFADPIAAHYATVRGRKQADRRVFRDALAERLKLYDGRMSLMWAGSDQFTRLLGVHDGERYAELSQAPDVIRFDRARMGEEPAEFLAPTAKELERLGVTRIVTQTELRAKELEEPDAHAATDQHEPLETLAKILGDYSVVSRSPADGREFARLLRRIEAGRVRPLKLLSGALAAGEINLPQVPLGLLASVRPLLPDIHIGEKTDAELMRELLAFLPPLILYEFHRDGDALRLQIRGR